MRQAPVFAWGRHFKADGQPGAGEQVSFEQVLIDAGVFRSAARPSIRGAPVKMAMSKGQKPPPALRSRRRYAADHAVHPVRSFVQTPGRLFPAVDEGPAIAPGQLADQHHPARVDIVGGLGARATDIDRVVEDAPRAVLIDNHRVMAGSDPGAIGLEHHAAVFGLDLEWPRRAARARDHHRVMRLGSAAVVAREEQVEGRAWIAR